MLTTPNVKYWTPVGNIELMVDIIEALCGGVGSIASTTLWTVIDSWDGTTREVPTGGLLANSTTAWTPGGTIPPSGSWIVLQCQSGERTAVHQSKWTVSGTTGNIQLIPYADWTPGGGTGASPTLPSRITATTSINIGVGATPRSLVWDESMVALAGYDGATTTIAVYLGEVHPTLSEVQDPRPFVHVRISGTTGWDAGSWVRYSPIDGTTSSSATGYGMSLSGQLTTELPSFGCFLHPVRLSCSQTSHKHFIGVCRHIANISHPHQSARTTWGETLGVRDWVSIGSTSGHLALRHDGTTLAFDELRLPLAADLELPALPGISPTIAFVTASPIASVDSIIIDVTDDISLEDVVIKATYVGGEDVIYTSLGFEEPYTNSTTGAISGGTRFTLINDDEWYSDVTVAVHAIDNEGQVADDTLAYTVTGGTGYPECPEVPEPDLVSPVISNIVPVDLGTLRRLDPVQLSITDDSGVVLLTIITASYQNGVNEVIYDGQFSSAYAAASTRTPIVNGYTYRLRRAGGWPSSPNIKVTVFDRGNNPLVLGL